MIDAADRRVIGMGAVIALGLIFSVLTLALAAGLAVRVFLAVSGV